MSFSDMKISGWMFEGLRNIRVREETQKQRLRADPS